jgi:hypothetical protein
MLAPKNWCFNMITRDHTQVNWLEKLKFETLQWPAQSPDLSPIESIWNVSKMRLKAPRPRPHSNSDISNAFHKLYSVLDDEIRWKTIELFRKKCEECVRIDGYPVKYPAKFKAATMKNHHTDYDSSTSEDSEYID